MKLLKLSLLLILIASILLLSGASQNVNSLPEKQKSSETKQNSESEIETNKSKDQNPPAKSIAQPTSETKKQPEPQEPQKHWYDSPSLDFLWQTTMPNWLVIAGWGLAFVVAWCTLRALR